MGSPCGLSSPKVGRRFCSTWLLILLSTVFCVLIGSCQASLGDQDVKFRSCKTECCETGCINSTCFQNCRDVISSESIKNENQKLIQSSSLLLWDCAAECEYQCMIVREFERHLEGLQPVQYHGKWPFKRFFNIQEPASVFFSIANLLMHLKGLLSFLDLIFYKLPQKLEEKKSPYYEYAALWTVYGILSINSWTWSSIFHSRDTPVTEKMDYYSAIVSIGYSLIVAIVRTLRLTTTKAQLMTAIPIGALILTHILYLNFYTFDYGLNMKVCVAMGVIQFLLWTFWGWCTNHPSRFKLWFLVFFGASAMLLELFDFPPIWGVFDAHSIWHAITVPLTLIWWSFIKDDAVLTTSRLTNIATNSGTRKNA